jgi:hypothetical protein
VAMITTAWTVDSVYVRANEHDGQNSRGGKINTWIEDCMNINVNIISRLAKPHNIKIHI